MCGGGQMFTVPCVRVCVCVRVFACACAYVRVCAGVCVYVCVYACVCVLRGEDPQTTEELQVGHLAALLWHMQYDLYRHHGNQCASAQASAFMMALRSRINPC